MGMKGGTEDLNSEINVTPMVDIMLVLLIIFMVTAPLMNQSVEVDLPSVKAQPLPEDKQGPLVLEIKSDKSLKWLEKPLAWRELKDTLAKNDRLKRESALYIGADKALPYEIILTAMAQAKNAGINKVMLLTQPTDTVDVGELDKNIGR